MSTRSTRFISWCLMQLLGFALAYGCAMLAGLLWHGLRAPVFLLVAVPWLWTGFKYAYFRERAEMVADLADAPRP